MTEKANKQIIMRNDSLIVPTSVSGFELRETLMNGGSEAQQLVITSTRGAPSTSETQRTNICTIINNKWENHVHIADNMPQQDKDAWVDTLKIRGIETKDISLALV